MNKRQEIVPVQLQDDKQTTDSPLRKQNPQRLIARLKCEASELFIYEGVREEILRILLTELYTHEDR